MRQDVRYRSMCNIGELSIMLAETKENIFSMVCSTCLSILYLSCRWTRPVLKEYFGSESSEEEFEK